MERVPKRTKAEQETLFRFDCEERVLWASTTTPWVARRWQRARVPLVVLSRYPDGTPATWEAKLPWTGRKAAWLRLVSLSLPTVRASAHPRAADTATAVLPPPNGTRPRDGLGLRAAIQRRDALEVPGA
jgi:hypothetical protein